MPAPPPQPFPPQGGRVPRREPRRRPGMGGGYAPQAPAPDPYASMRPPPGRQFDLRPVDDGVPVESVRRGGFRAALVLGIVMAVAGGVLGVGFGMAMSGRRAFNETNRAAKAVQDRGRGDAQVGHPDRRRGGPEPAARPGGQAGPAGLRPQADRGPGEGEGRSPARHLAHLPGRLLPDVRPRGRQPDVLLLRHHRALRRGRALREEEQGRQGLAGQLRRQADREGRHQVRHRVRRRRQDRGRQPGRDAQPGLQGRRHRLPDGSAGGLRDPGQLRRQLEHPAGGCQARRQDHGAARAARRCWSR